jgi:hypothetical protein
MSSFPFGGMEMYEIMDELQKRRHTCERPTRNNRTRTTALFNMFIEKGWDPEFVRTEFQHLEDTLLKEWPPNIFIEHWAKLYIRHYGLQTTLRTTFLSLGFTHTKAMELASICCALLGTSYSHTQVVELAIEYAMGHYDPIRWNYFTTEARQRTSLHQIRSICSTTVGDQLQTLLNAIPREKETTELYFHTTSWAGCLRILVDLDCGAGCVFDFGLRPGFYLVQDIYDALDWGARFNQLMKNQIGIIVFCLPKRFPDTLKRKHLIGREWRDITHISRKCKPQPLELAQLRGYDFVYGPMVANVEQIEDGARPEPHRPPKLQLVSKSAKGDVYLQDRIVQCIYFDPR